LVRRRAARAHHGQRLPGDILAISAGRDEEAMTAATSPERPLHVRVAEALHPTWEIEAFTGGMVFLRGRIWAEEGDWYAYDYSYEADMGPFLVPEYDTDWSATGPLLEKYKITSQPNYAWIDGFDSVYGDTRLEAACHLILALHAAGKLG
jgi:hypothetical protein